MRIPFNVDAYTARLIGRENVSKLDGAILELVKNAYDADANMCLLYYEESTGTFYIMDNGSGMSKKTILDNWMTIGYSSKKSEYKLASGRIQTGAKGIGRFALDRISDTCTMLSKSKEFSIEWSVNWSEFNTGKKITEVGAELEDTKQDFNSFLSEVKNAKLKDLVLKHFDDSGTIFKLNALRDTWNDESLDKIKKSLATLIPPEIENIFQLHVFSEKSSLEESKVLVNDGIYSYDYKVEFDVDEDGKTKINIHRAEFDFKNSFDEVMKGAKFSEDDINYFKGKIIEKEVSLEEILPNIKTNTIGEFSGTFYFAKLSIQKEEKERFYYKDISDRRDNKDTFGGIKIYRDNFRVRPYGEPKTTSFDWLLLSNRKLKSPAGISHPTGAWRVGADQLLGSVHISRTNLNLPDQSNREGIVETKEFMLLREFILSIIQEMERDRQYVCRNLRKYYDKTNEIILYEEEISSKAKKQGGQKQKPEDNTHPPQESFIEAGKAKAVIDKKDTIIKELEDENRLLRVLATTGIVTNTYIHEIKEATGNLGVKIATVKDAINKNKPIEHIASRIDEAIALQKSFNSWFEVTIEMVKRKKREMQYVEFKPFLSNLLDSWAEVLKNKNVEIITNIQDLSFNCFPYDIESIMGNLIANSVHSFEKENNKNHIINIDISKNNDSILINYSDNGKGLELKYKKQPELILEPFETSIRDSHDQLVGTGMGMWIIDKTIKEYKGNVDLSDNINTSEGFYIKLELRGDVK